jgi:carbamoyl-phosphate synthase large subunit
MDKNIQKVLVLGSGALKIGEAGEFDYSGSQALKALEGGRHRNRADQSKHCHSSNLGRHCRQDILPSRDPYFVEEVIKKEKPQGILLAFGGQTALNCGIKLEESGVFEKYRSGCWAPRYWPSRRPKTVTFSCANLMRSM